MRICNVLLRGNYLLIICLKIHIVKATTCYWPNGAEAQLSDGLQACNATVNGGDSGCCALEDVCTTKGFCFSSTVGYMYRGGCTNQGWNLDVCFAECLDGDNNDFFANLSPCPAVNGTRTNKFCCNKYDPTITCCDKTIDWTVFGRGAQFFIPHGENSSNASAAPLYSDAHSSPIPSHSLSWDASPISNSTSSPSSTITASSANQSLILATSSCKSPPQSNKYAALGAEIGVPLGVLLLLALGFLLLAEHRRRKSSEKTLDWIRVRDSSKEKAKARGRKNRRLKDHNTVFELGTGEVDEATGHCPPTGHDRIVAI